MEFVGVRKTGRDDATCVEGGDNFLHAIMRLQHDMAVNPISLSGSNAQILAKAIKVFDAAHASALIRIEWWSVQKARLGRNAVGDDDAGMTCGFVPEVSDSDQHTADVETDHSRHSHSYTRMR